MSQFKNIADRVIHLFGTVRTKYLTGAGRPPWRRGMTKPSPFKNFKTSPEIIRPAVMMNVRFPMSLRNVEDLLHERGIEISQETVRFLRNRFGPAFAAEIRKRRVLEMWSSL
jgi:putative transposase